MSMTAETGMSVPVPQTVEGWTMSGDQHWASEWPSSAAMGFVVSAENSVVAPEILSTKGDAEPDITRQVLVTGKAEGVIVKGTNEKSCPLPTLHRNERSHLDGIAVLHAAQVMSRDELMSDAAESASPTPVFYDRAALWAGVRAAAEARRAAAAAAVPQQG